jgi:hypothetical protein
MQGQLLAPPPGQPAQAPRKPAPAAAVPAAAADAKPAPGAPDPSAVPGPGPGSSVAGPTFSAWYRPGRGYTRLEQECLAAFFNGSSDVRTAKVGADRFLFWLRD